MPNGRSVVAWRLHMQHFERAYISHLPSVQGAEATLHILQSENGPHHPRVRGLESRWRNETAKLQNASEESQQSI